MAGASPRADGIRWIIVRHGIREDISQDLVTVVTLSHPHYPENITNEGNATHDVRDQHECTR